MPCSSRTPAAQSLDCLVMHWSLPLLKPSLALEPSEGHSRDSPSGRFYFSSKSVEQKEIESKSGSLGGNSEFLRSFLGVSWVDEQRLGSVARVTLYRPSSCSEPSNW